MHQPTKVFIVRLIKFTTEKPSCAKTIELASALLWEAICVCIIKCECIVCVCMCVKWTGHQCKSSPSLQLVPTTVSIIPLCKTPLTNRHTGRQGEGVTSVVYTEEGSKLTQTVKQAWGLVGTSSLCVPLSIRACTACSVTNHVSRSCVLSSVISRLETFWVAIR